jgi:dienelactone hydrolase
MSIPSRTAVAAVLVAAMGRGAPGANGQSLFDIDRAAPARAFVLFEPPAEDGGLPKPGPGAAAPAAAPRGLPPAAPSGKPWPPMAQRLLGGVELTKEQITLLRRSPGGFAAIKQGKDVDAFAPAPWATIIVAGAKGEGRIHLVRGPHAEHLAWRESPDAAAPALGSPDKPRELKPDLFAPLAATWNPYVGPWDRPPAPLAAQKSVEIPAALRTPGAFWMDERTLTDRGLMGTRVIVKPATRKLGDSRVFLRVPKGYSPRTPVGLLVYIDPSPVGEPPDLLEAACDELGIAIAGFTSQGNSTPTGDRMQLVLDTVAKAMRLVHLDPARIYATGISGGGRMSSLSLGCFPDLFSGAVSMAGVAHYRDLQNPEGKIWPAYFQRPSPARWKLLTKHRLASTTGEKDFNHFQGLAATDAMSKDGLTVRVWNIPGLGHEFPPRETYAEALRWVDEPGRAAALARAEAGATKWAALEASLPTLPAELDDAARIKLLELMEEAPWSEGAWKAAAKLGL